MSSKARGTLPSNKARSRKATLQTVDTNPLSYDRTDPFSALNALRKLLAALPSRVGGCQYKLSPDEHRLSLHLLTLVEPFVGLSPSHLTITRQPTEILDAIVFHIDTKRDLLSLALSCRRLHAIVFPRHYDYRAIRCKVSSLSVWNHLIVNRALSRNVRQLEILDERASESECIPSGIMTTDTDLESTDDELDMHVKQERFLVSALSRMSALDSFTWSCNHSPISIDHVWPTLLKCQTLRRVEINDNMVFIPVALDDKAGRSARTSSQTFLPALRTVSLQSTKHSFGATKNPDMSRISAMLNNCPILEDLNIGYSTRRGAGFFNPVADDFLLCGRWPTLRTLKLTNLWCSPQAGFDAAATFLFAHSNLEVLHLDIAFGGGGGGPVAGAGLAGAAAGRLPFVLPPNSLPRLRELESNKEIASAILQCPCDATGGRPLEAIKGVRLSGSAWDHVFLMSLKTYGASGIRRLELSAWNEMEDIRRLVECVPKLTWLDVGKRGATASGAVPANAKPASVISTNVVEWTTILSRLPDLTTFHGVRFFYEVSSTDPSVPLTFSDRSRVRKNDEVASMLAWKCSKLRRLDHWEEGSGKVIVLRRDGEKVRYEVRRIKS
ncbi:hypothetical protein AcV7_001744 [Taiwanofungus camphoratus]|nr:hypothetical protein AcV7_001744 [Antrodia cinnamomea]